MIKIQTMQRKQTKQTKQTTQTKQTVRKSFKKSFVPLLAGLLFSGAVFSDSPGLATNMKNTFADSNLQTMFTDLHNTEMSIMNPNVGDSLYSTTLSTLGGATATDYIIGKHVPYCNPDLPTENNLWGCSQQDDYYKNADIKVSTILGMPLLSGSWTPSSSGNNPFGMARAQTWGATSPDLLTPGNGELGAAHVFFNAFLTPNPGALLTQITDTSALFSGSSKKYDSKSSSAYAQALSYEALLSVPRYSLATMVAKREVNNSVQIPNPNPSAQQTAQGTLAGLATGQATNGTVPGSFIQYMETQAASRLWGSTWSSMIDTSKNSANLAGLSAIEAERANMQAFQMWMMVENYKQMERVEALLSALVVLQVRGAETAAAALGH